jgi:hypothetical protein
MIDMTGEADAGEQPQADRVRQFGRLAIDPDRRLDQIFSNAVRCSNKLKC